MRKRILRCLLCCLLLLGLGGPAAWAREYSVLSFNAQITVKTDGSIEVTEIIDTKFVGSCHGIYRTIPVEYTTPQGLNYTLLIEPISVTDDHFQALNYDQSRQGRNLRFKITVPHAQDATRTVIIRYRVLDGLRFFENHDELYWNVTGNDWEVPIESARAQIELPEGVTGLRAIAYTGVFGSRTQDADVTITGNAVTIVSKYVLSFHSGMTTVVGWDKGIVHEPGTSEKIARFLRSNWPLFLPLVALAIMLYLWWTRGRDPEQDAITVQYEPPDKLTPAECGTLVDNEASMRDITATLIDLAVKGFITIEQTDESHLLGLSHSKGYTFHLKQPATQWAAVRPHEREMLSGIFDDGANTSVKLSDLQNSFYTHLPAIRDRIFNALMGDGYYLHRPDTVRAAYVGTGVVLGALLSVGGGLLGIATGVAHLTWTIAGIATGAVVCLVGWFMPARTIQGARTYAKVLGFEDFLERVEADRIEKVEKTPELFEKYLPYAMALHVEKKWVQAFAGIAMQPPRWYQAPFGAGFQPYIFVNDLNFMTSQAGTVMSSSPRSSGGSGFGGGGGSGGGFGGGGGGAW